MLTVKKFLLLNSFISKGNGWFFATELLVLAELNNFKIREIPIIWKDDPYSKVKLFSLISEYIIEIIKLKIRILRIFT